MRPADGAGLSDADTECVKLPSEAIAEQNLIETPVDDCFSRQLTTWRPVSHDPWYELDFPAAVIGNPTDSTGLLFTHARVATVEGLLDPGWLATSGAVIRAYGKGEPGADLLSGREVIDAGGAFLLPGFVDVHAHGAVGREVMDADVGGLQAMARFYASHGVTSFLPTTWTAGTDETLAALHAIADVMHADIEGARIVGAHMEGPYLNASRCGAQDPTTIRAVNMTEARRFLDTGVVRLITIAPEIDKNAPLIDECVRRSIRVSAGHTDATYDQMERAAARGVTHLTHAFNAMRPLNHREPGGAGAALTLPKLTAELIADNVHVHPAVMRLLLQARGTTGVVLVTDAIRPTGLDMADFSIGGRLATVVDGVARLADGTLAGSLLTMDAGLRNLIRATALPLAEIWPVASRNGARAAGIADRKGNVRIGLDADLVLVDDDVSVGLTVVEGRVMYRAGAGALASS